MVKPLTAAKRFSNYKHTNLCVFLILVILFWSSDAYALIQLLDSGVPGNTANWAINNNVFSGRNMSVLAYAAGTGLPAGSFRGNYARGGGGGARRADGYVQQAFTTPNGSVYATMYFDFNRERTGTPDLYLLEGQILDSTSAGSPNETGYTPFSDSFTNNNYAFGAWLNTGWTAPVLLSANTSWIVRIYYDVTCNTNEVAGAYVDNVQCNISPSGLAPTSDGLGLTWNNSAGAIGLNVIPYNVYRRVPAGAYGPAYSNSGANSWTDPSPDTGVFYYVITDVDSNGLESPASVEVTVARTQVRDGADLVVDSDSIMGSDIDCNWDDVGFAIDRYEVAVGTAPGLSNIAGWTNVGSALSHTFVGLSLTVGNTYYVSVRTVIGGVTLNWNSSDGFVSSTTEVRDGVGVDETFTNDLTSATLNWDALLVTPQRYEAAIGTTPGGAEVTGWINVGLSTNHTFSGLSLTNGNTYYSCVRAYNPAAVLLGTYFSNGFSPVVGVTTSVRDGTAADIDTIYSGTLVDLNWDAAGIALARYEAALGTAPGLDDVAPWVDMGLATSGNLSGFSLTDGSTYYCSVRLVHSLGVLGTFSSDGFKYIQFNVRDGLGADADFSFLPDAVQVNWDSIPSAASYEVAIGTTPGGTDILNWTNRGLSTSGTLSVTPNLTNGVIYYSTVRPLTGGGVPITTGTSNGFQEIILTTTVVRDGLGPDIAYSYLPDRVEANWDHPASALIRYEMAVGTSPYAEDISAFSNVGHSNQATVSGLSLASGTMYYATVRGINGYGIVESLGCSNGFYARRDPVLVDTASQTYFHNARVLDAIDTTTNPGSIQPRIFSSSGGATAYWRYRAQVTVTEPGVTSRINAPCRIIFAGANSIPGGQMANIREIRVTDEAGNEIPRFALNASLTNPDIVFLVNMGQGETKNYWVYWGNPTATDPAYGFTNTATDVSANQWTPYYSRKNTDPGAENPILGATLSNADDLTVTPAALTWPFYYFGVDTRAWRMNTNGFLCTNNVGGATQYTNRWATYIGNTYFGRCITPMWSDLWPGGGSPIPDGIFYNVYPDRVVYTWRANRFGVRDDIYITQAVLYKTSDIALRYSYLSTLGIIGPAGTYDRPENTENTVGISNCDNTRWLTNTPLIIGIGKSPRAFYQCCDAFRGFYTIGAIEGPVGGWSEIAHIESMVFDPRTANPKWLSVNYDCAVNANNQLTIMTRSGPTPLPTLGGWTAWSAPTTVSVSGAGSLALTSTNRYIQYRVGFIRNALAGALAVLNEVSFVYGGIGVEEIKATTPDGVSQGQTGIPVEVTIKNFYSSPVNLNEVKLIFTLGTYVQNVTGPVLPTSIPAGGTTSVFFTVDVDPNSVTGTATIEAMATATVAALTFYDGDAQLPHQWQVKSKAQIVIEEVETDESFVNKGQTDLYVRMQIANYGETPFRLDAASLTFTLGLYDPPMVLQSPAIGTIIPGLSNFTATFTVNISNLSPSGVAIIGGTASGTNTFSGQVTEDLVASITDSWTIQNPSQLVLEEIVASDTVYRGQTNTPVFLRVSNDGEATARWISSSIIPYLSLGLYDDEYAITPFEILIPGGFESIARYGVDISPVSPVGISTVDASVTGKDSNTGSAISWTNALIPGEWKILAEKVNTYKDAAHTQTSISFNRPTAGTITVYAKVENLAPFGEFVVRWVDPVGSQVSVSAPLTADASGTVTHEFVITPTTTYGIYKVKATNPINTVTSCENQFEVVSPAALEGLFTMPAKVSVGQSFTASFTYNNTGGAAISSAYTSALQVFGPGIALDVGGLPPVMDVPGNGQATATFSFVAQGAGNFSASATAYGFDANSGLFLTSPAVTSNICLIQNSPVVQVVSVTAVPTVVYRNQKNLSVVVNVRNTGQATAVLDNASLTFSLGSFDQSLISPALPYNLAGGANVNFTYDIGVSPVSNTGNSIFTQNVLWYDQNWPASVSYLTGSPPEDNWTIQPVGINLSANLTYTPLQSDFNRLQTVYIRVFGVAPLSNWYRIRLYNSQIAQAANSPAGWVNVSPQLSADADGYVDHLFALDAAATIGTWSVVMDTGTNAAGGPMVGLQYFRVQNPGNLVASLTISPSSVFVGENFTVTMLASNTVVSGSTISNASPSTLVDATAVVGFAGSATLISGPSPASMTVKSMQTQTLTYTYRADSDTGLAGSYYLTVNPAWYLAGYDLNTSALVSSGKSVTNPLIIYGRKIQLAPDSLDYGSMLCGDTKKLDCTVQNIGNYNLDYIKWITTDINGPAALKISKSNLSMNPDPVNGLAGGGSKAASGTLFIPYNKEAGDYIATMSVYNDRNQNDLADIDEAYDLFNVKVTVPPCKRVFAVQDVVDLGAWPIGQTSLGYPVNVFSGGNIALTNVKFMQINGTNTFVISTTPSNPGPMGINGSTVASVVASIVNTPGFYIATWTVWDDAANFGVVDAGEASDTFQVHIQTGIMNYTLAPLLVDAGSVEPSGLNTGFGLTLTNDAAGLPLTKLKLDVTELSNGLGDVIASDNIAIYTVNNPLPPSVSAGQSIPIDLALFVPAGKAAGTYSATQYIYHDDNGNNKWDASEFRASFTLQATVPVVPKVQVLVTTVGLGGIAPGTTKIVTFNCRNTGNVDLTGLMWEKVNLVKGADVIAAVNASFPPSELFTAPIGSIFSRQIQVTVPPGQPYGVYQSVLPFWLFADMAPTVDGVRTVGEASSSFLVNCEVGDLLVDIVEPNLAVTGGPNSTSSVQTLSAKNVGTLALVNIKATGSVLVPTVVGPLDIPATRNVFTPSSLGGANITQIKTSDWSVSIPANASAGTYLGTVTVWEDSNYNNLIDAGEAFSDCPVQLTVLAQRAIDITQTQLDLGYAGKNSVTKGVIEIKNAGNMPLTALWPSKSALIFGANNIPVGSITFETIPASPFSLAIGASTLATVSVSIGAVQGAYTYSGIQRIFEDHVTVNGAWDATEVSDTFELIISVGVKVMYETNPTNPTLDFGNRDVYGNYSTPVTVFSGAAPPLPRVRWKVLTPLTGTYYTFPVASLTFAPAASQFIGGNSSRVYSADVSVGFPHAGLYVATAAFYDDENDNLAFESTEASATFQVKLTVNASYIIDIYDTEYDFGQIAQGATQNKVIMFQNAGNIELSNFSWAFNTIDKLPDQIAGTDINPVSINDPVNPGDYASATVSITVPAALPIGVYGPSGPQALDSFGFTSDNTKFKCEVIAGGAPTYQMESGTILQEIATKSFDAVAPTNRYFLSAWICPGTGTANISFITYNEFGEAVGTVTASIDKDGKVTPTITPAGMFGTPPFNYYGVTEKVKFDHPYEKITDDFYYYRVYIAFDYTYDENLASNARLLLGNSSPTGGDPFAVWIDGVKLEQITNPDQTKPTTYHHRRAIFSPTRKNTVGGQELYYEW